MAKHHKRPSGQQRNGEFNNFDLNNFDLSQFSGLLNNFNSNQLSGLLNNVDLNQITSMIQGMNPGNGGNTDVKSKPSPVINDKRIELLNALKPLVDSEKSLLLDKIIQLYTISRIVRK
jgi:hypothetical protein